MSIGIELSGRGRLPPSSPGTIFCKKGCPSALECSEVARLIAFWKRLTAVSYLEYSGGLGLWSGIQCRIPPKLEKFHGRHVAKRMGAYAKRIQSIPFAFDILKGLILV